MKRLKLNWDNLDIQSREGILEYAGFQVKMASSEWSSFRDWERLLIMDSIKLRSHNKVSL